MNSDTSVSRLRPPEHRAFTSFSNVDFRIFFFAATTFSGLSVGLLGAVVGIHNSLSYSAAVLLFLCAAIFVTRYLRGQRSM